MSIKLIRKAAVVTGAGSGIGRSIASQLAADGYDLTLNDLSAEDECLTGGLDETARQCQHFGAETIKIRTDITNRQNMKNLFETTAATFGRLDCCVANAYYAARGEFIDQSFEDIKRTVDVSLLGNYSTIQLAAKTMVNLAKEESTCSTPREDDYHKIIVISSVMASYPYLIDTNAPYNCSKAALNNLVGSVASSLTKHKILINAVAPGWMDTQGERKFSPEWNEVEEQGQKHLPSGLGRAQDIADAVSYLASNKSNYVNGTVLTVDGGFGISQRVPGLHPPITTPPKE